MSMIFQFRMLADENDNFAREYEVPYDMNLREFNDFIFAELGYEDSMTSFFTADDRWEKLREFTFEDMGKIAGLDEEEIPVAMEGVTLGQIIHQNRDRLIFTFDMFADRSFFLELTEAKTAENGVEYPRTTLREAPAPDQYDPSAVSRDAGTGSIFDDAMDDFSDFEGDESYDDDF